MFLRLTIALFSLLLIQACAQTQQGREVQSSGFLGTDYARLKEGNEGEALLVYNNANVNLAKIAVLVANQSRGTPIRGMTSTRHSSTGQGNCATGCALKAADRAARAE